MFCLLYIASQSWQYMCVSSINPPSPPPLLGACFGSAHPLRGLKWDICAFAGDSSCPSTEDQGYQHRLHPVGERFIHPFLHSIHHTPFLHAQPWHSLGTTSAPPTQIGRVAFLGLKDAGPRLSWGEGEGEGKYTVEQTTARSASGLGSLVSCVVLDKSPSLSGF